MQSVNYVRSLARAFQRQNVSLPIMSPPGLTQGLSGDLLQGVAHHPHEEDWHQHKRTAASDASSSQTGFQAPGCSAPPLSPHGCQQESHWRSMPETCSTSHRPWSSTSSQGSFWLHSGLSLQAVRGFAAAGSAPKPAAKRRHSQLKLYSVRNSKLRSNFEQVWPTLRLTDEEAMLFKRNSRVFLTDMGKSIPLTTKFELAKATQEKVPHQDARSLLYESDLHLDAVGEHPRFLKIRRLRTQYATKLQSLRKLRVLMGFARRYMLQELYELSLTQPGPDRVWKFICAMESKLPNTVLRMGLAPDILAAKSHVSNAAVAVNGCREPMPHACHIQPADVVGPSESSHDWFKGYMASHIGKDMRNAVSRSWGFGGGGGNLSGPRMREALQAFGEAEQASGNSSNPHNTQ